jgi:hypothetical protein
VADFSGVRPSANSSSVLVLDWTRSGGAWVAGSALTTGSWANLDDTLAGSVSDGDTAWGPAASWNNTLAATVTGWAGIPSDFGEMDSIELYYSRTEEGYADDTRQLTGRFTDSTGATDYSNTFNIRMSSSSPTNLSTFGGVVTPILTSAGLAATKSDWESARLVLTWIESRSMGADSGKLLLIDIEMRGTYTTSGPPTVNFTGSGSWGGWTAAASADVTHAATLAATWGGWSAAGTFVRTHAISSLTASWGGWTGAMQAAPVRSATLAADWGAWTGAASATVEHPATFAASWGTWSAATSALVTHSATLAATWGGWTGVLTATRTHFITALAATWGGWTAAASPIVSHDATLAASWGAWTGAGTFEATTPSGTVEFTGAADWGAWTAATSAVVTHEATLAASWGGWSAAGSFTVEHSATLVADWGAWTADATFEATTPSGEVEFTGAADWGGWSAAITAASVDVLEFTETFSPTGQAGTTSNFDSSPSTSTSLHYTLIDDDPDSPDTGNYIYTPAGSVGDALWLEFELPTDILDVTAATLKVYAERLESSVGQPASLVTQVRYDGFSPTLVLSTFVFTNGVSALPAQLFEVPLTTRDGFTNWWDSPVVVRLQTSTQGASYDGEIRIYAVELELTYVVEGVETTMAADWGGWTASSTALVTHEATLAADWGGWSAAGTFDIVPPVEATFAASWGGWTGEMLADVSVVVQASLAADWGGWSAAATADVTHEVSLAASWGSWTGSLSATTERSFTASADWGAWTGAMVANQILSATFAADWGAWTAQAEQQATDLRPVASVSGPWNIVPAGTVEESYERIDDDPNDPDLTDYLWYAGTSGSGIQSLRFGPDQSARIYSYRARLLVERLAGGDISNQLQVQLGSSSLQTVVPFGTDEFELAVVEVGATLLTPITDLTDAEFRLRYAASGAGTTAGEIRVYAVEIDVVMDGFIVTQPITMEGDWGSWSAEMTAGVEPAVQATLAADWGEWTAAAAITVVHEAEAVAEWGGASSQMAVTVVHFVDSAFAEWGTWDAHFQGPGPRRRRPQTRMWAKTLPSLPGRGVNA